MIHLDVLPYSFIRTIHCGRLVEAYISVCNRAAPKISETAVKLRDDVSVISVMSFPPVDILRIRAVSRHRATPVDICLKEYHCDDNIVNR